MRKIILVSTFIFLLLIVLNLFMSNYRFIYGYFQYSEIPTEYRFPVEFVDKISLSTGKDLSNTPTHHQGIDIVTNAEAEVRASVNCIVWNIETDSLGYKSVWALGEGRILFNYGHLANCVSSLKEGTELTAGSLIGYTDGVTANSSYMHFGMFRIAFKPFEWQYVVLDPLKYISFQRHERI